MARLSLQVKNVASLVLAAGASVAFGFASRRFDSPGKPWLALATAGLACLLCQLGLIFVESKEEEELSLLRSRRMAALQHEIDEAQKLTNRIQKEIDSGTIVEVAKWTAYRRRRDGE